VRRSSFLSSPLPSLLLLIHASCVAHLFAQLLCAFLAVLVVPLLPPPLVLPLPLPLLVLLLPLLVLALLLHCLSRHSFLLSSCHSLICPS
jgi:hypothetical protein